ncbi:multidrug efflux transporter transcriptional repressor AcrR [Rosenbergiella sp. S61]|uniref:Multidrug efflux transporter transcriptional repressor AcrR n=1 Tax=Rosenbergiella gaditana TaxID=2726987 RepID=A0ABS5SZW3_9GAMM|nr:multidrug efflux transporter transcriptional repressor AcrR [Rosenbergiella gaditana]MBT0724742.1 multidrug efflux transporter transcriptional repressor AcrR [Rosenbergiella gaditana]
MARKTKAQALETKSLLIEAAIDCFAGRGVSATSLSDIAEHAGMTRGAIYWHFKNKTELFKAIWVNSDEEIDRLHLEFASLYPNDPLGQLKHFLISFLQSLVVDERRRKIMEIIYHKCEFVGEMQSINQLDQKLVLEDYPKIAEKLSLCIHAQQLPSTLDTQRSAVVCRAYITGIIENWLFSPASFDMKALAPTLVQAMIDLLQYSPSLRITPHAESDDNVS